MVGYLFFNSDRLFTKKEHSIQSGLEEFSKVLFYTLIMLSKTSIKVLSLFFILFGFIKLFIVKRDLMESPLNSFSDSLNMKILSSNCRLQTCKSIWRVVSPTIGYLFFGLDRLFMKKYLKSHLSNGRLSIFRFG